MNDYDNYGVSGGALRQTEELIKNELDNRTKGELVHPVTNVSGTEAVTTSGHYYSVKWIGQCEGVTALRDGMMVNIKIPVQGNSTYHTVLNINGLGEHPVCRNVTNEADAYVADSIITLIYDANAQAPAYFDSGTATTVTGVWKIGDYDSVNIYQLRHNNGSYIAATALPANVICLQKNETTLLPVNTVGTVGTSKVLTTESFNPFGQIVYVNESRSAGEEISPSKIYEQYQIDLRLSFNTGTSLTNYKDVYICAVPQSDGLAKLDPTTPIVQELPTTEDGKIYIYLGHSYSAARVEIYPVHPVYWFKGGKVVPYTVLDISAKADKVSGAVGGNFAGLDGNGNLTDSGMSESDFAKVSVYSANPAVGEYKYYNGSTLSDTTTGRILLPGKHYEVDEVQTVDSTDYGLTFYLPIVADDGTPYLEGYDPQTDDEIHNVQEWFFAFTASANASGITFRLGAKGSSVKVSSAAIEAGKTYEVTIVYNKKRNEYYVVQFGFSES